MPAFAQDPRDLIEEVGGRIVGGWGREGLFQVPFEVLEGVDRQCIEKPVATPEMVENRRMGDPQICCNRLQPQPVWPLVHQLSSSGIENFSPSGICGTAPPLLSTVLAVDGNLGLAHGLKESLFTKMSIALV